MTFFLLPLHPLFTFIRDMYCIRCSLCSLNHKSERTGTRAIFSTILFSTHSKLPGALVRFLSLSLSFCTTYYYKFCYFIKHTFIILLFLKLGFLAWQGWVLCSRSGKIEIKVATELGYHLELKSSSKFISVVGRTEVLSVLRLKSSFSCWLAVASHSQLLEADFKSYPLVLLTSWLFISSKPAG